MGVSEGKRADVSGRDRDHHPLRRRRRLVDCVLQSAMRGDCGDEAKTILRAFCWPGRSRCVVGLRPILGKGLASPESLRLGPGSRLRRCRLKRHRPCGRRSLTWGRTGDTGLENERTSSSGRPRVRECLGLESVSGPPTGCGSPSAAPSADRSRAAPASPSRVKLPPAYGRP